MDIADSSNFEPTLKINIKYHDLLDACAELVKVSFNTRQILRKLRIHIAGGLFLWTTAGVFN